MQSKWFRKYGWTACRYITLLFGILLNFSCERKLKFDKAKWNDKYDLEYPYREVMLEDLVKHHHLIGLTYKQLTTQIGEPARYDSNLDNPYYNIIIDYGWDIDPVYTKVLRIQLNKDSVVAGYKVEEWRKN
jgi:hypothetical protein